MPKNLSQTIYDGMGINLKVDYLRTSHINYTFMPGQEQEEEQPTKVPERKPGVPGVDLPEIGDILDEIDGILEEQPDPEDYEQPSGQ
jgi:hypothetical protein